MRKCTRKCGDAGLENERRGAGEVSERGVVEPCLFFVESNHVTAVPSWRAIRQKSSRQAWTGPKNRRLGRKGGVLKRAIKMSNLESRCGKNTHWQENEREVGSRGRCQGGRVAASADLWTERSRRCGCFAGSDVGWRPSAGKTRASMHTACSAATVAGGGLLFHGGLRA